MENRPLDLRYLPDPKKSRVSSIKKSICRVRTFQHSDVPLHVYASVPGG